MRSKKLPRMILRSSSLKCCMGVFKIFLLLFGLLLLLSHPKSFQELATEPKNISTNQQNNSQIRITESVLVGSDSNDIPYEFKSKDIVINKNQIEISDADGSYGENRKVHIKSALFDKQVGNIVLSGKIEFTDSDYLFEAQNILIDLKTSNIKISGNARAIMGNSVVEFDKCSASKYGGDIECSKISASFDLFH